jgi:hypothetical protein
VAPLVRRDKALGLNLLPAGDLPPSLAQYLMPVLLDVAALAQGLFAASSGGLIWWKRRLTIPLIHWRINEMRLALGALSLCALLVGYSAVNLACA